MLSVLADRTLPTSVPCLSHSARPQIVRFARVNIQIYDAHLVDLYRWVCTRHLVGVKVEIQ
jgi:hypothetical protein